MRRVRLPLLWRVKISILSISLALWAGWLYSANAMKIVEQAQSTMLQAEQLFLQKVWPILEKKCLSCHGEAKLSELDLRSRNGLLKGGTRGPAVIPGEAEKSLLYEAILQRGTLAMPPA